MTDAAKIKAKMEIHASSGNYIGAVDKVEGNMIRVAHVDPEPGGDYHFIPLEWVKSVDEFVHLDREIEDVTRDWQTRPARARG